MTVKKLLPALWHYHKSLYHYEQGLGFFPSFLPYIHSSFSPTFTFLFFSPSARLCNLSGIRDNQNASQCLIPTDTGVVP